MSSMLSVSIIDGALPPDGKSQSCMTGDPGRTSSTRSGAALQPHRVDLAVPSTLLCDGATQA
jgi:hypothetical protein